MTSTLTEVIAPPQVVVLVRCELTELYTTDCAHCRRIPDPPMPGRVRYAARSGRCSYCGDDYEPGDRIRPDGTNRGFLGPCCEGDW